MRKIRVLIVDDSVVVRKIISDTISKDPALHVAGKAANGNIALQKIPQVKPDIITLDITMPGMDGLKTLKEIRRRDPLIPVIMLSALTERDAAITLDALALGANDYVTKPSKSGSIAESLLHISEDLIPKIKAFCANITTQKTDAPTTVKISEPVQPKAPKKAVRGQVLKADIVAIGVSTGGPNALAELIPSFPAEFPVPIVIVQHMPTYFTKLLAERLNLISPLKVMECTSGQLVQAGEILIAPGNYHMFLENENNAIRAFTNKEPHIHSCRPSVDVLFKSVSSLYGANMVAVILTGMGQDGLIGCELIHNAGGTILAQDEASSVVWGMPGYVANAKLADKVLPLNEIGAEINALVKLGRQYVY